MQWLLKTIVGSKNDRDIKRLGPFVREINAKEEEYQSLSESELKGMTDVFRKRLVEGETLEDLQVEAFAVVKNACRRLFGTMADVCGHELEWNMIPFDVQLIGGTVLHQGKIAEMATGEGKTLVATMPVYLNALSGKGVHVVTVNDYLAQRDSEWMGHLYTYLGLTVGCIQNNMPPTVRREHYACDITYGTNSEFGFDYLRDNGMAHRPEEQVQRGHVYAIVDEIDSILIDEARTPLIISGPAPHSAIEEFRELRPVVDRLVKKQNDICSKLIKEAKEHLEKSDDEKEDNWEAQTRLYQVHQGMPKNKQLMALLEEPAHRKLLEKIEAMMLIKERHDQAREFREELYFTIDEKGNDASLTDKGCETLNPSDPDMYVMPDLVGQLSEIDGNEELAEEEKFELRQKAQDEYASRGERIHAVDQLIRAFCVYEADVHYVVQDNQVIIVDEYTGRLMPGRRWSDGLHQAVEAKENVKIERETQTLATITIQNYFRLYEKLSGMTGTAETEADEFYQIYKLDVVVIPTNRPIRRADGNDLIYKTQREKFNAAVEEIAECHAAGQPVLVGTISVDTSEMLGRMLKKKNIPHSVLNAKNHAGEAEIVSRAGQAGAVTIATNMAGRGTDIKLGKGVVYLDRELLNSQIALDDKYEGKTLRQTLMERPCGLHVIGTERHESRRIDRQLRGRCARQGDPGSSRFYVSLEDDLMRLFGSDRIASVMERFGLEEGQVLEANMLNKSIERAQRRVEQQNFAMRKRTLDYDDVMNKQREIVYGLRSRVVGSENVREHLYEVLEDVIYNHATEALEARDGEGIDRFVEWVDSTFPIGLKKEDLPEGSRVTADTLCDVVMEKVKVAYEIKIKTEDPDGLVAMERYIALQAIDTHWQEFLRTMDSLRQGVGLRAYGQQDPLVEYKKEAYTMFADLMERIRGEIANKLFRSATSLGAFEQFLSSINVKSVHDEVRTLGQGASGPPGGDAAMKQALQSRSEPVRRDAQKVGRNDPCTCGSGKKYKKCCGAQG